MRTVRILVLIGLAAAVAILGADSSRPRIAQAGVVSPDAPSPWLKGYARTISGETIGYHSPYPDATVALIVRATDGTMAAEWESEPVPSDFDAPFATFVWMCGLATGKGAHRFDLAVDGKAAFSFRTGKDASLRSWTVQGPEDAELSFRATMVDQFDELFGFMLLKLPKSFLRPSYPVRMRVIGENGGSRDWHMVFQYDLRPFAKASGEQALVRRDGKLRQLVRIDVSHIAPPAPAAVTIGGRAAAALDLETGFNTAYIPVEPAVAARRVEIGLAVAGRRPEVLTAEIRPVTRRTLYLLPHSHNDIGYSDPQVKIEKDQWAYYEKAIEIARRTAGYPPGARFKWNTEILWAVESYLKQASPEKREAFIAAVRDGSIGLQALLANELTGVCSPDELFEFTSYARRLAGQYGLTIDSAMITDIPSFTWSIVPALAQCGVRYFSSGPNYMPNLNDAGDRIGGALKACGDKPFYWLSPSGKEKILFWTAGRGYSWFHGLNLGKLSADKKEPVFDYCRALEESGYPYDIVQVRYTVGGDNGPPDPSLPDTVKRWNEEIESPKLVIATSHELFADFERRYGGRIPSIRGDFTPYWEDGAASSARETAMNRAAAARLVQAETLWTMIDPAGWPASAFDEAWRQILLWDEHTWGAADSVSDPDGENARVQWAYKQAFALEADKRSRELLAAAAARRPGAADGSFAVLNTCSWNRSGVVMAPPAAASFGDRVIDGSSRSVPSQRLASGELVVLAENVPAFGERRLRVVNGEAENGGFRVKIAGTTLDNGNVAITIDPVSGGISNFRWRAAEGVEFVDPEIPSGLNSYFYVPGRDPKAAAGVRNTHIEILENGPLVASLRVESDAPGCRGLLREYRLTAASDRVEIVDLLDKAKVRDKESVHIAFPFCVPDGMLRVDLGWTWIRPEADQIAGSCKDFFCVQNGADLSNSRYGLTWTSLDAPLVEVGGMTDETIRAKGSRVWRTSLAPSQILYSYVMNNYWHTNYKADQEGIVRFRYAVEPHTGGDLAAAKRIALDAERPLLAVPGQGADSAGPILRVSSPDIVVTSLRPSRDGRAFIARLYNPSLTAVQTTLAGPAGTAIRRSDPDERPGAVLAGIVTLTPQEIVTIRIARKIES